MGQPAARVGDMHVCPMFDGPKPHVGGPVLPPCKPTVLIGGLPAATITDRCACLSVPDIIVQGAQTVLINNLMAARLGDATVHGGRIVAGCLTVLIGGPTYTTPSFIAKFLNTFLDDVKFTAGVVVGFGEGLFNTVESLINATIHPIDTIESLFHLAKSVVYTLAKRETWTELTKKETWQKIGLRVEQIYNDFEQASLYDKGVVIGQIIEFMAELLVPVAKAKLATEAIEASKIAEAARVAAGLETRETTSRLGKINGIPEKKFTTLNPGPLDNKLAITFRSATYVEKTAPEGGLYLYRYWGGTSSEIGDHWFASPNEVFQAQLTGAILPSWGNRFSKLTVIKIPEGTVYYEGVAAPQVGLPYIKRSANDIPTTYTNRTDLAHLDSFSGPDNLLGGGMQIVIPRENIELGWIVK